MNRGRIHRRVGQRCIYIRYGDRASPAVAKIAALVARRTWSNPSQPEYDIVAGGHSRRATEDELVPVRGKAMHGLQEKLISSPPIPAPPPASRPEEEWMRIYRRSHSGWDRIL